MALLAHTAKHLLGHKDVLRHPFRFGCSRLALWLLIFLTNASLSMAGEPYAPEEVKAVFLLNFVQFVDWPRDILRDDASPFVIGVLEDKEGRVQAVLQEVVQNQKIVKHPIKVVLCANAKAALACHILYVGTKDERRLRSIFADLKGRSILTVGESEEALRNSGCISFVTERKIRLRINLAAAKAARLKISSKLLRLAEVVNYD